VIGFAHLVGWALLRGTARSAPGSSRRRGTLALGIVVLASAVGLLVALVLTGGHLFLPNARPYIP
jgi:hypothetical protein